MKKKKRVKKRIKIIVISLILLLLLGIGSYKVYKVIEYHNSTEYKLLELGYKENELAIFKEKMNSKEFDSLLELKYDKNLSSLVKQKYYLQKNFDRYLAYQALNPETSNSDVVAIVNVHADSEWYDEDIIVDADTSKDTLMLVNKFHQLSKEYTPDNIVDVSVQYAYNENRIREDVYKAYIDMWNAAKEDGSTLIATSSYRLYEWQATLYENYTDNFGERKADSISARPGFSEHQTGLAMDILTYNCTMNDFVNTDEFKWLSENAYKYGFIMRYPKDKEYLTGYAYESWHYRYIGKDIAKKVHDEGITYDEYYAFYIEK